MLSLGTGIIWRPNIYDRVLLLLLPVDPGPPPRYRCRCRCRCRSRCRSRCLSLPSPPLPPLRPCSLGNKPSEGGARGPITTCPDLTAIRGLGISYALPHETRNSRALLFGQRIALKSCETRAVPSLPSPNLTAIVIPPSLSTRFYFLLFFFFFPPTSSHHLSSDDDSVEWEASNSW